MAIYKARATVRIDFLGGGSDAPPFCLEHGGGVINGGLNRYAIATLEVGPHLSGVEIRSLDLNAVVRAASVAALEFNGELDLIKAALRRGGLDGPLRLTTESEAPPQSGLGASASVLVSILAACRLALGQPWDRARLADEATIAERGDLGLAGGAQDHYGAAFGGLHYYRFTDQGTTVHDLAISKDLVAELEHRLLLVYSGMTHLSGNIHADIKAAYRDDASPCKQAMFGLARIAREGCDVLRRGDLRAFAQLLNENWRYHKDLHFSCTNEHLDQIYATARRHGMIGGKTCGAGGGGCLVFFCEEGRKAELRDALAPLCCQPMPFSFDFQGVYAWESKSADFKV